MIVKVSDKISIDFWEKKMDLFDRTSNDAGSLLEKRKYGLFDRPQQVIKKLYGFKKLTKVYTPVEFHFDENWGHFLFNNIVKHSFYEKF